MIARPIRCGLIVALAFAGLAACTPKPPDRSAEAMRILSDLLNVTGVAQCVNPQSSSGQVGLDWQQQSALCQCLSTNIRARYSVSEIGQIVDDPKLGTQPRYLSRFLSLSGQCLAQITREAASPPIAANPSGKESALTSLAVYGLCSIVADNITVAKAEKANLGQACSCAAQSLSRQISIAPSLEWAKTDVRSVSLAPLVGAVLEQTGRCWEKQLGL